MNTRLALAVLLPFVACAVQWLFWDIFKPYVWFLFIPTVFLSAWVGGLIGGLVATVIGTLLAWYIFIPPAFSFPLDNPASLFSIVIFIFTGCLFSFFFDQMQRSKRRANEALSMAESANEKTSQLYQKLKEAQRLASVGNWVWDIQSDTHIWSEEVYRIYGRDSVLPPAIYPEVQKYFTPESWATLSAAVEKGLAEGVPYECDAEVLRPPGCPRRWIAARGEAIRDADGNIVSLQGTVQDITERKRVEQALRESEERLAVIIDSAMDGVISVDEQQKIRLFNPAAGQMFGLSTDEALDQPLSRLIPESFRSAHKKHIENFSQTGMTGRRMGVLGQISGMRANGEEFPIEASISQSVIADGKMFTVILRDITERKQIEDKISRLNVDLEQRVAERTAELTAANRELDTFAYAVAHDLRAPLRAMSGFSQALREDYGGQLQGEALIFLDQIGLASRKMSDLIDGLLTLSRSTRGGLQYEVVDISTLSKRLLVELAQSDPERQVTVEVEAELQARGDARMIEVMMRNLLGNAWKYSAHAVEPSIRLYAEQRDNARLFCIADNGAGFDMGHANRLFKPFQRLHRQDEFPGIGIGLATVQRIVNRHGGAIEARGEPGKGAIFCFTLSDTPEDLVQDKKEM
jgi:PAS domain S-box-containing protein